MKFVFYICAIVFVIGFASPEVINTSSCSSDEIKNCVINEARISPCKEALKKPPQACKFKKQNVASLAVDLTPEFATDKLHAQMYWPNGFLDLPLAGMDTDACKTTKCPTVAGEKQTYTYDLQIENYFPISTYDVKLLIKGEDPETQSCCFIYKIKISK